MTAPSVRSAAIHNGVGCGSLAADGAMVFSFFCFFFLPFAAVFVLRGYKRLLIVSYFLPKGI